MELYDEMNGYLANQEVMYIKLHNLHWYVKGASFFTLHAKFEELYDYTAEVLDEVAERLLALGQSPIASMKSALEVTKVKELDDQNITSKDAVKILEEDIRFWVTETEKLIKLAEDAGDVGTADMFTGFLREYQKTMWMLDSYLA